MAIVPRRIYHINDLVSNIDLTQLCFEPLDDADLGFRMWCGKDEEGNVTKWLAKNEDAYIKDLRLIGATTIGSSGYLMHDASGDITGGHTITSGSFDHGGLQGLGDDDHTQYIRVSGTRAFTGDQSMGTHNLTNIGTLSGATVLGFSNSYFAASDWTGDMPLSSSSAEINTLRGFAGGEVSVFGALNLGITALTNDNGVSQVKGAPFAWYAGNALLITKVEGQPGFADGFRIDYDPEGLLIEPESINTAIGTETGTLDNILTINQGGVYHVDEDTGSPAIIVNIGWGGVGKEVTYFDRVILRVWYHGTAPLHSISVRLQNYATTELDEFETFTLSETYQVISFAVPACANYIGDGSVVVQLYHAAAGSSAHDLEIDYAALATGNGGGGLVSMQAAYDGGKTITMASGNAGPVVINSGTEASPCLSLSQTQAAFSSYVGSISNASTSDDSYGLQFTGDAGGDGTASFQYGHRVWTKDSVITIGRSQTTENFVGDAFFRARSVPHPTTGNPYRHEASLVAWDTYGGADYAWVTAYTTYSPNGAPAGVQGSYLELRCSAIMYVEAPEVDLNEASAITNATSCTFGNQGSATFDTGVITAIYSGIEKCIKKVTVDANVTNVKLTPPHGSGVVILRVLASGERTITNFTKSDGTTPCVTWKNDIDPDVGALTIPTGTTATFSLLYDETADNYEGWVSLDV